MNYARLPIGLILDHTALVAYEQLRLGPGETIGEVWDTDQAVALPTWCIAAAIAEGAQDTAILALLYEPATLHVEHDFRDVGRWARALGASLPHGAAALAAWNYDAPVLTENPEVYRKAGILAVALD